MYVRMSPRMYHFVYTVNGCESLAANALQPGGPPAVCVGGVCVAADVRWCVWVCAGVCVWVSVGVYVFVCVYVYVCMSVSVCSACMCFVFT